MHRLDGPSGPVPRGRTTGNLTGVDFDGFWDQSPYSRSEYTEPPPADELVEEIEAEYKGKPLSIGFNARYLMEVLDVLAEDGEIDIELKDELSPSVIRKSGIDSYLYVLMPMRL